MSGEAPLLDVRDLQVRIPLSRGTVRAVDGASFRVERGEALGLVGESGCGKSMTLRAILGLLPRPAVITGGQVLFEGEDLAAAPTVAAARAPRQGHRHDLPGADDGAEPGDAGGRPDRGGARWRTSATAAGAPASGRSS